MVHSMKPEDRRAAKGGWAPGLYMARCRQCDTAFIGDKRAIQCADCAYDALSPTQRERECRAISEGQRCDSHYYSVARQGYDVTTGERGAVLQRWAAKRSKQTRDRLFSLIAAVQRPVQRGDDIGG